MIAAQITRALAAGEVVVVRHPVGGNRFPVQVFDHPLGLAFLEDGAFDPWYFGNPYHVLEGEAERIGPGRWRVGSVPVEVTGES